MLLAFVLSFTLKLLLAASENAKTSYGHNMEINRIHSSLINKDQNMTMYIDKTENILRIPNLNKNYEEHKTKQKKSPKRTIQKIIKKNKSRKKIFVSQETMVATKPPLPDINKFYAQEELSQKNDRPNITQGHDKISKKKRKWNITRYPMPFKHLVSLKRRNKREIEDTEDREDVFILTDLDNMQILREEKDQNVVNAYGKKYW